MILMVIFVHDTVYSDIDPDFSVRVPEQWIDDKGFINIQKEGN